MTPGNGFYTPTVAREAEQRDAEARFEGWLDAIWRDPEMLVMALVDADENMLAAIARLSLTDSAAAGEQFKKFAQEAVCASARLMGQCEDFIPPYDPSAFAKRCMGIQDDGGAP